MKRLPEPVETAIYWLNAAGRSMVADQLALWADERRTTPTTRNGSADSSWKAGTEARHESAGGVEADATVERLKIALRQCKAFVVGDRIPNWYDDSATYLTRGKIADVCDFALAYPQHPRDVHLTVEKRADALYVKPINDA